MKDLKAYTTSVPEMTYQTDLRRKNSDQTYTVYYVALDCVYSHVGRLCQFSCRFLYNEPYRISKGVYIVIAEFLKVTLNLQTTVSLIYVELFTI